MGIDFNIYRDTDIWRNNFEEKGKFRPNISFIESKLKDSSIKRFSDFQNTNPDLLVILSYAVARILSNNKLKPTQLRRFYHYVKNLQNKIPRSDEPADLLPDTVKARLKFLPPKLAGASSKKREVEALYKVISACLDRDKIRSKGDFEYFVEFFEAILDYHQVLT